MTQKSVCLYFQVHQPYRVRDVSFFEENPQNIFEGPEAYTNHDVFEKVADKCYLPATRMFLDLLHAHPDFRISYSLSGVFLEQCQQYGQKGKEILSLFRELASTGRCEFLAETYYHSLSCLFSKQEFAEQIQMHTDAMEQLFGVTPRVFRNTELIYRNDIGEFIRQMGFGGMVAEGWDEYLQGSNPHVVRQAKSCMIPADDTEIARTFARVPERQSSLPLLLKSYQLSDDIAFRFGNKEWSEHPLSTEKFASWVHDLQGDTVNLFMDYETIGEHQWEDTGIFDFFSHLPVALEQKNITFRTPSETIAECHVGEEYDVPDFLSWADSERNLSAWLENDLQHSALQQLQSMESALHQHKEAPNAAFLDVLNDFRKLQTSDHMYYMCTKYWSDGDVHKYFSPYESPYDAYICFMNAMRSLQNRVRFFGEAMEQKEGKVPVC